MDNKRVFQIVYGTSKDNPDEIHSFFKEEYETMKSKGILVGIKSLPEATELMFRGGNIRFKEDFPTDKRFIHTFEIKQAYNFMSVYYPLIKDLSIETYFFDDLNEEVVSKIKELGWKKAFIKKDTKALEYVDEDKSVYPITPLEEMKALYTEANTQGKYAVRKFIEKEIFQKEERYWVLNGNIYHRHNKIPDIVKEAVKRLNTLGGRYYTVDATPDFIVEVNPGESSDRHGVNSAELFASWFKKEFGG